MALDIGHSVKALIFLLDLFVIFLGAKAYPPVSVDPRTDVEYDAEVRKQFGVNIFVKTRSSNSRSETCAFAVSTNANVSTGKCMNICMVNGEDSTEFKTDCALVRTSYQGNWITSSGCFTNLIYGKAGIKGDEMSYQSGFYFFTCLPTPGACQIECQNFDKCVRFVWGDKTITGSKFRCYIQDANHLRMQTSCQKPWISGPRICTKDIVDQYPLGPNGEDCGKGLNPTSAVTTTPAPIVSSTPAHNGSSKPIRTRCVVVDDDDEAAAAAGSDTGKNGTPIGPVIGGAVGGAAALAAGVGLAYYLLKPKNIGEVDSYFVDNAEQVDEEYREADVTVKESDYR